MNLHSVKKQLITLDQVNWIVGAKVYPRNPDNGHTLKSTLQQVSKLDLKRKWQFATLFIAITMMNVHDFENEYRILLPVVETAIRH